ncbi:MAG: hypothetical protein V3T16_11555 [Gemmatimonadales bacterium]
MSDLTLLVMRVLHILLGVFWAGTLIFNAIYLQPSLRDAGPDAAKVAAGLMRRRFLDVMPLAAAVTILSGLWLYWLVSGGFQVAYMRSATGMTIGLGAVAAIVAFTIGVAIMRPAMLRAAALSQAAAQAAAPERDAQLTEAQALRARAGVAGKYVAALLVVAVVAMAIARYV